MYWGAQPKNCPRFLTVSHRAVSHLASSDPPQMTQPKPTCYHRFFLTPLAWDTSLFLMVCSPSLEWVTIPIYLSATWEPLVGGRDILQSPTLISSLHVFVIHYHKVVKNKRFGVKYLAPNPSSAWLWQITWPPSNCLRETCPSSHRSGRVPQDM